MIAPRFFYAYARIVVALAGVGLCASGGCQSHSGGGTGGAGGAAGGGTTSAAGAGASDAGAAGAGDAATAPACLIAPAPLRQSGGTLALAIEPHFAGKVFVFGEPNPSPSGATVTPLNFRFFVSHVALLRAGGAPVPVDLVTATGALEPYGVHLFNAEEAATATLRVLAPAGTYSGVTFLLGLDEGCNGGMPSTREPPLTDASQLTWPHLFGYLFLRYEGRVDVQAGDVGDAAVDGGDADSDGGAVPIPLAVHMGGIPGRLLAPALSVTGAFSLSAGAATNKSLFVDMDALFAGAEQMGDPSTLAGIPLPPGPEVQLGENLRQHAVGLDLFTFAPQ